MFICKPRVQGVSPELLALYQSVCPSTIGHMTDFGFLKGLKPLLQDFHFVGNAVTVQLPHMDAVAIHKSLDLIQPGDVLLVDMSGDVERACVGEIVMHAAVTKKVAAVIVDGCITDVRAIRKMGVPVFSKGVSPITTRSIGIEGSINVPISICGVVVKPGDLVVGDDDGVFVIDPLHAVEYGKRALEKQAGEAATLEKISSGLNLSSINGNARFFE
mgnify:CR=1 FL=1